jgi:hypothetical protein
MTNVSALNILSAVRFTSNLFTAPLWSQTYVFHERFLDFFKTLVPCDVFESHLVVVPVLLFSKGKWG